MTRTFLVIAFLLACPLLAQHAVTPSSAPLEVTLPVTVTDKRGAVVTGFPTDLFDIYEDGELLTPIAATRDNTPWSLGFLLDYSASMIRREEIRLGRVLHPLDATTHFREMLSRLITRLGDQTNEFFLISFNHEVSLTHDLTSDAKSLLTLVEPQTLEGRTALRDAVRLGLATMENASNDKRALILISDGGENESDAKRSELKQIIRESNVPIYSVAVSPQRAGLPPSVSDPFLPNRLADQSGGTFLYASTIDSFMSCADQIAYELRGQYSLRYIPRPAGQREWRKVEVKIRWTDHRQELLDAGLKPPLTAHTRSGYYYEPVSVSER